MNIDTDTQTYTLDSDSNVTYLQSFMGFDVCSLLCVGVSVCMCMCISFVARVCLFVC